MILPLCVRLQQLVLAINLARTDGSTTITVTDTGHGAEVREIL